MCACAHRHCTLQLVHCYTLHMPAQTATRIIHTRASVKRTASLCKQEVNEKRNSHCKAHTKTLITEGSEENTPVLVCIISTLHIFLNLKKMDRYHTWRPQRTTFWKPMALGTTTTAQGRLFTFARTSKISQFLPNSINTKAPDTNASVKKKHTHKCTPQ